MPFVLDNSVCMAWCFEDEKTPYAATILAGLQRDEALVPKVWPFEMCNALLVAERRQRLTREDSAEFVNLLRDLSISVVDDLWHDCVDIWLDIGRQSGLSGYNASYLVLALRRHLPLATQDQKLIATAGQLGVPIMPGPSQ